MPWRALPKPAERGPCKVKLSDQTAIEIVFPEGSAISAAYIKYFYSKVLNGFFNPVYRRRRIPLLSTAPNKPESRGGSRGLRGRQARWEHLPSAPGRMHGFKTSQEKNLSREGNTQGSGARDNECPRKAFVSSFISQLAVRSPSAPASLPDTQRQAAYSRPYLRFLSRSARGLPVAQPYTRLR